MSLPRVIRIWRITYCTRRRPRIITLWVKVPSGGAYEMTELLTRMVNVGQIRWFCMAAARPEDIERERESLQRWLPSLLSHKGVDWTA